MDKHIKFAAVILLGFGLASGAAAEDGPPTAAYAGVSAGHALFSYLEDFICQASGACSQEDDALMYAAGFEFSRRFAVEAGWIRHRALEAVVTFPAFLPTAGSRPIREASTRCRPSMARPWDGCRWTGGALRQAGRVLLEAEDQGEPCDGSVVDDEDIAPLMGAGADVAWNERWRMRGEWLGQTGGKAHAFLDGIAYRF